MASTPSTGPAGPASNSSERGTRPPLMSSRPASRGWFWIAIVLTALKLWLVAGQRIYAIGPSFHDDLLFVRLAEFISDGRWLGPYDQYTLAKGPMYSFFIAAAFKLGVPLL